MRQLACLVFVCLSVNARVSPAQQVAVTHERSSGDGRFEIVQSTLGARATYRIDKVSGQTDVMLLKADSSLTWEKMPRRGHTVADTKVPGKINYQIFISGLGNRHTYLININTGATWVLVRDSDEQLLWDPIA